MRAQNEQIRGKYIKNLGVLSVREDVPAIEEKDGVYVLHLRITLDRRARFLNDRCNRPGWGHIRFSDADEFLYGIEAAWAFKPSESLDNPWDVHTDTAFGPLIGAMTYLVNRRKNPLTVDWNTQDFSIDLDVEVTEPVRRPGKFAAALGKDIATQLKWYYVDLDRNWGPIELV